MPSRPPTPISLDQAKKMLTAAEAEAARNNWPVAITIVDPGGLLVAMHRIDNPDRLDPDRRRQGAHLGRVAAADQGAGGRLAAGGAGVRSLAISGVMPLEGGIPIMMDGKIIGGISVSGVTSAQDAQVARAGLDALK